MLERLNTVLVEPIKLQWLTTIFVGAVSGGTPTHDLGVPLGEIAWVNVSIVATLKLLIHLNLSPGILESEIGDAAVLPSTLHNAEVQVLQLREAEL